MIRAMLAVTAMVAVVCLPQVHAEPSVSIVLEKTVFGYCEKLFYVIEVSEVTGDPAIIHIKDDTGTGSSAIPVAITALQNPVPALIPFEKEIFPLGKYHINVEYAGQKATAEFVLEDLGKKCIPSVMNPIVMNWVSGVISDGFLVDAFQKFVDRDVIDIPFEIGKDDIYDIDVPDWVKSVASWWLQGAVTDDEFANVINYLVENGAISDGSSRTDGA